jgi:hypothetical protein
MKKKTLTLTLAHMRREFKSALPPSERKRLQSIIRRHARDAVRHFKTDGWDLDYDVLQEQVIEEFLGDGASFFILSYFLNEGRVLRLGDNRTMLCNDTKKSAVKKKSRAIVRKKSRK